MNQDTPSAQSPFAALSYQEQQDRWLEWRSRQLDYKPITEKAPVQEALSKDRQEDRPRLRQPNMRILAPAGHRELDSVLSRHRQALRQAGAFQSTSIDG